MRHGNYWAEVSMEDLVDAPFGSVTGLIHRTLRRLLVRSGAVHVPRAAEVAAVEDPSRRVVTYRVTFNSRAWTG